MGHIAIWSRRKSTSSRNSPHKTRGEFDPVAFSREGEPREVIMAEVVTQFVATSRSVELALEQPFYIPMTGPAARPRRSLKHDDTFIVLDSHGDIGASAGGPDGLFN